MIDISPGNLDSSLCIKKSRDITLLTKGPSSQSYGFSSSPVQMQELDYKASRKELLSNYDAGEDS